MTNAQIRNIGIHIAIAVGAALLATGVQLGAVLSGTGEVIWRPLAATFVTTLFAALTTAAGTSLRPRVGREDISGLVSDVGPSAAKAALENAAAGQIAPPQATPDEIAALVVAGIEAKMRATPAPADSGLISRPPVYLDDERHAEQQAQDALAVRG